MVRLLLLMLWTASIPRPEDRYGFRGMSMPKNAAPPMACRISALAPVEMTSGTTPAMKAS